MANIVFTKIVMLKNVIAFYLPQSILVTLKKQKQTNKQKTKAKKMNVSDTGPVLCYEIIETYFAYLFTIIFEMLKGKKGHQR